MKETQSVPQQNYRGKLTHQLAIELRSLFVDEDIDGKNFRLFYHPHSKKRHLDPPVRNGLIKLQPGENTIELSRCDIMIVSVHERRAVLLIEVEESSGGAPPKTIFGDTYGVWMASAVALKEEWGSYRLSNTALWTIVFEPEKGGKDQQYKYLQDCFTTLREPFQKHLHDDVRVTSTEIVPVKDGPDSLSNIVISKMRQVLPELFTKS